MAQHRRTLRESLRSALAHRKLADDILDSMFSLQTRMDGILTKIDGDTGAALDTDYVATYPSTHSFASDDEGSDAQFKTSLRKSLRSALRNKGLADDFVDSMDELDAAMDACAAKLDAEAGTLNDGDYASILGLTIDDTDTAVGQDSPHQASRRVTMVSAVAHRKLGNTLVDAMNEMQSSWNSTMDVLDTGTINGAVTGTITFIDSDSE